MEASSMCSLASGSLDASLWPWAFVVRGACRGSRPLRKRSSRVSPSEGRRFQLVVGASRRLNSQQLSAAMEGSARSAPLARLKRIAKDNTGSSSRLARSVAVPSVTPNYSIERTRPGKPGRASHVKRWASR
jgi:hypothetical protein